MKHGCHNLPREAKPLLVQDGWLEDVSTRAFAITESGMVPIRTRIAKMVEIPFVNTRDCRHDKKATDPGCDGCIHAKPFIDEGNHEQN